MNRGIRSLYIFILGIIGSILFLFGCIPIEVIPNTNIATINLKLTVLDETGKETLIDTNMVETIELEGQQVTFKVENNELILPRVEFPERGSKTAKIILKDGKIIVLPLKPPENIKEQRLTSIKYVARLIKDIESKNIEEVEIFNSDISEKERLDQKKMGGVIFHINRPLLYGKNLIKTWIDYHPIPVQTIGITDNGDLILDALFFNKFVKPYSKLRFIVELALNKFVIYTIRIDKKLDLKFKPPSKYGEIVTVTFEKPTKIELNLDINIKIEEEEKSVDLNYTPPKEEPTPPVDTTKNTTPLPTLTPGIPEEEFLDTTFELSVVEEWETVSTETLINVNDITNITINDNPISKANINIDGQKIRIKKTEPDGKKIFKIYLRDGQKIVIIPFLPDNINEWRTNKRPLDYKIKLIKDIKTSKFISVDIFLENAGSSSDNMIEKMFAKKAIKFEIKRTELYKKPIRKVWIDLNRIPRKAIYIEATGNLWLNAFYVNKYVKEKAKLFLLIETEQGNFKVYYYQFIKSITLPEQPVVAEGTIQSFILNKAIELKPDTDIKEYKEYSHTERYEPGESEIETR